MKQFICNNPILLDRFSQHSLYKTSLLNYFDKEEFFNENYKDDNITKVDWHKAKDFNRPWVKLIIEDLHKHFEDFPIIKKMQIDDLLLISSLVHSIEFRNSICINKKRKISSNLLGKRLKRAIL